MTLHKFAAAAEQGDLVTVNKILADFEMARNTRTILGPPNQIELAIESAAEKNHVEVVQAIVGAYPQLEAYDDVESCRILTAYNAAFVAGREKVLEVLRPLAKQFSARRSQFHLCDRAFLNLYRYPMDDLRDRVRGDVTYKVREAANPKNI